MNLQAALKSQYHAALNVLRQAIEKCPDELWYRPAEGTALCWRVAYHTLYFTHFYLHQNKDDFTPWERHREEANFIAFVSRDNPRPPKPCDPFTQADLLDYLLVVDAAIESRVDALDLSAPQCGFPWYQMSTLEHQLVNLRHIQHHAAILSNRIRQATGVTIPWVGKGA